MFDTARLDVLRVKQADWMLREIRDALLEIIEIRKASADPSGVYQIEITFELK